MMTATARASRIPPKHHKAGSILSDWRTACEKAAHEYRRHCPMLAEAILKRGRQRAKAILFARWYMDAIDHEARIDRALARVQRIELEPYERFIPALR